MIAETSSRRAPGGRLLARAPLAHGSSTLYARLGDAFGWLCVLASALIWAMGRGRRAAPAGKP
jgi:apolipoprotein N-acyltransferase